MRHLTLSEDRDFRGQRLDDADFSGARSFLWLSVKNERLFLP
jgi:hypothetical protein